MLAIFKGKSMQYSTSVVWLEILLFSLQKIAVKELYGTIFGVVYYRDTDRSEGRDTGSSRKERFSLFLLSRDFHRVLGVGVGLGVGLGLGLGEICSQYVAVS